MAAFNFAVPMLLKDIAVAVSPLLAAPVAGFLHAFNGVWGNRYPSPHYATLAMVDEITEGRGTNYFHFFKPGRKKEKFRRDERLQGDALSEIHESTCGSTRHFAADIDPLTNSEQK
jgi:hypothetical protein